MSVSQKYHEPKFKENIKKWGTFFLKTDVWRYKAFQNCDVRVKQHYTVIDRSIWLTFRELRANRYTTTPSRTTVISICLLHNELCYLTVNCAQNLLTKAEFTDKKLYWQKKTIYSKQPENIEIRRVQRLTRGVHVTSWKRHLHSWKRRGKCFWDVFYILRLGTQPFSLWHAENRRKRGGTNQYCYCTALKKYFPIQLVGGSFSSTIRTKKISFLISGFKVSQLHNAKTLQRLLPEDQIPAKETRKRRAITRYKFKVQ